MDRKKSGFHKTTEEIEYFAQGPDTNLKSIVHQESKQETPAETLFAHYKILQELGRGGMGVVYKAYDTKLKRTVALKVILSNACQPKDIARLLQEASAMAKFEHPNIIRIYEIGELPKPYFTMEYIDGCSLSSLIKEKRINSQQSMVIIGKVAEALYVAHKAKIIHRDIKPANIMVTNEGEPKLMDFGLAKIRDGEVKLSKTGDIMGTPAYMPPEQINGKATMSSDIYSLGATFYECLTGRPPFQGDTVWQVMSQITTQDPIPPSQLNPDISVYLEAICLKCMNKVPKNRYHNAKELARDLKNFLTNRPILAKPYGKLEHCKKLILRHKIISIITSVCLVFLITMVSVLTHYNLKLKQSKSESEMLARASIQSLKYAYKKHNNLLADVEFLKPLKEISQSLSKIQQKEYEGLAALISGYGEDASEQGKGLEFYSQRIKNNPKASESYTNRGIIYQNSGKWNEALQDFSKAISLDPKNPIVYHNRGVVYKMLGRYQEAISDFNQAIALDAKFFLAYDNKASIYEDMGQNEDAIKNYTHALSINQEDALSYSNRGKLYSDLGKKDEAIQDWTRLIAIEPKNAMAYRNRGLEYANSKRTHEAIQDFSQAIRLNHKYADAYYMRGCMYERLNKMQEAIADWENAMAWNYHLRKELYIFIQKKKAQMGK